MKVKDVSIRVVVPVGTFAGGLLAGYFAGKYVSWCRYEEILAKDLTDMEKYYEGKHPEKDPRPNGYLQSKEEKVNGQKIVTMGGDYKKPNPVDYASMYDPAQSEHPEEDTEDIRDDDDASEYINNEFKANKKRAPKMIKAAEFGTEDGFSTQTLLYYTENERLTIHEQEGNVDDMIYDDELEDYVGDALVKFGFTQNDEERIYVRNYAMATDFEIVKVFGAFGE